MTSRKRRKFITDSDNSDTERPGKSKRNSSSDSLSESSEEEEWTLNTESRKVQPKKPVKKDEKKAVNSAGSMESSDEGELSESESESLSEDSDATFNDGLDENCVGDVEDRNRLMQMTEAERERVLFERMEKRESMKTRQEIQRKLKLQKKKEEAAKVEADRKKSENDSKNVSRAQRMRKSQTDDKGKGKAIDELKAKREAHKARLKTHDPDDNPKLKTLLKTKDVYTDDEEDDDRSLSSSASDDSGEESEAEPTPEIIRNITTKQQLTKIRLSRFKLEKWVHLPFFKRIVCGCFIRIGIGDKMGKKVYRVAEIFDVVETPKVYSLGNSKTNKGLKVRHGLAENMYRLEFVSNQDFTDSEFQKWRYTLETNNLKLPSIKFVDSKAKEIKKTMEHEFTDGEVDLIVKEKFKFRRNPLNFATKKSSILNQKVMAETLGDFAEVEKLKADLEDLESTAEKANKARNKALTAISFVNDKNRKKTTDDIETVLREEFISDKLLSANPFRRRKMCPVMVTPKYVSTEDAKKTADILKALAAEKARAEKAASDEQNKSIEVEEKKKSDTGSLDPFDLHNGCDIDIDIGPMDLAPAISPTPDTASNSRRTLNFSDYMKRTGL